MKLNLIIGVGLLGAMALESSAVAGSSGVGIPLSELCGPAGKALAGVYHPYRLRVVKACAYVTGIGAGVRRERDGDYHIQLRLDAAYAGAINQKNVTRQNGDLVVEITPSDRAALQSPRLDEHVLVVGPYVIDTKHGWAEIHPVRYWIVLRTWGKECTPSNSGAARSGRC